MVTTRLLTNLQAGSQLDQYILLENIGSGGQAAIWSAWDNRQARVVAIKTTPVSMRKVVQESFEREAHIVASLRHPHILPFYEFKMQEDYHYIAMQYVSGGALVDLLAKAGPLPTEDVLRITGQIAAALDYAHKRRIVHRDLKPGNILLDTRKNAYLTDFGLARDISRTTGVLHTGHGTAPYAPPEQHTQKRITARSDIYSLGILVYEMLTGDLPWEGAVTLALQQIQDDVSLPDPAQVNPTLPSRLATVLRAMTAVEPEYRPESVLQAFEMVVSALGAGSYEAFLPASQDEGLGEVFEHAAAFDAANILDQALTQEATESQPQNLSYTHFVFVNSFYTNAEKYGLKIEPSASRLLLRHAMKYGSHIQYWWQKTADPGAQLEICEQILSSSDVDGITHVLEHLARVPSEVIQRVRSSPSVVDKLLKLISASEVYPGLSLEALQIMERAAGETKRWQEMVFSEAADQELARIALSGSAASESAIKLIGKIRSLDVLRALLEARETVPDYQLWDTLLEVRQVSGSLPGIVPPAIRLRLWGRRFIQQFIGRQAVHAVKRGVLGLIVAAVISGIMALGWFAQWNIQSRDVLIASYTPSNILTIVEIDDETLETYGRWDTWSRSQHAELITRLTDAGAKAILLDIAFASDTDDDAILREAFETAENVVLPVLGQGDAYHEDGYVRYEDVVLPAETLLVDAVQLGHPNVMHSEVDGYVRAIPVLADIEGQIYPSIAFSALQSYLGLEAPLTLEVTDGYVDFVGRRIPVSESGEMLIHYAGPPAGPDTSTFAVVSYEDVLNGNAPVELLENKLILVGMTATAEPDLYLTPVSRGRPMYGIEILANVVETVWSSRFIVLPPLWVQIVILFSIGVMTALISIRPWLSGMFVVTEIIFHFLLANVLFEQYGVLLGLLYPILTIILTYALVVAYRLMLEIQNRQQIMSLLESRVTSRVARETMRAVERGELKLGGQVQEVSILFADLRGYERFSEDHAPEDLIAMVNTYMEIISAAIFASDGTLAHSEGDQVMAIFNAPLAQPDHAWRAVKTALDIQERVQEYHKSLSVGHSHLQIESGCGIHTGRAIVGYTGTTLHHQYTALGDTVNVAARLTHLAEPGQVIIGQTTYELVGRENLRVDSLPAITLKGRLSPLPVFSLKREID